MAFDQETRNLLQRFVNDARGLLKKEFTRQLQSEYGLDPTSGVLSSLSSLRHLNDQQRETARILRDTYAHYRAEAGATDISVLDRILREQAFTVLNRLCALRMAEARGLLIETVKGAYQARGFQLYARVAGNSLGEVGDVYRTFLSSVFDELSSDLPSLFDRFAPQGRLFPSNTVLLELLALINATEIDALWAQDETIGWIYQYFNSKEERSEMRAHTAPRNSRELAVRNQFFTPRYVVEFLVDNTLGRQWYNWTGGQTGLLKRCQYLLVKSDERPVPPAHLRDPRTVRLLDPACGSMHFGLYAFDLFLEIYREAWGWEQTHGAVSIDRETGSVGPLKAFSEVYTDQNEFLKDVPRLILEHNIFGVDIDPRAAQIASLALWLRAQRAWHDAGLKAKERPLVGLGHVLAAVAPPGELEFRQRFMERLKPKDAELFEQTLFMLKSLPELGVLLRVEEELPKLIRKVIGASGELYQTEDSEHWQAAEFRLRAALMDFVSQANATFQGRLFAQDAIQGFGLIDLCRMSFDVVVMNPPFGALSLGVKEQLTKSYPRSKNDLMTVFVERGLDLLRGGGCLGAITSRSCFFLSSFQIWREQIVVEENELKVLVDLGLGVMDDAMVEAAAYVLERR